MQHHTLPLADLLPHPCNSNVMPDALFDKLVTHLKTTGRYPPLIVRPVDERYQLLDGHHRAKALRQIGHTQARCEVWGVDDDEALLLLATLNRLEGRDDPRKRAALLREMAKSKRFAQARRRLPEDAAKLRHCLAFENKPPAPAKPKPLDDMPVALHFFLLPAQKRRVEQRLRELDPSREAALMKLIER